MITPDEEAALTRVLWIGLGCGAAVIAVLVWRLVG